MSNQLKRLWQEEKGQDLVEYALLLALVCFGSVAAMGQLASAISHSFDRGESLLSKS